MSFRGADHRRVEDRINKALENAESTLAAYAGMADQLVRDLAIEEALHLVGYMTPLEVMPS